MNRKKLLFSVGIVTILLVSVGGVSAVGNIFNDVQRVSFGEVTYEQSELTVDNADVIGPGTTVETVEVRVDMGDSAGPTEATVEVWLLGNGAEKTTGAETKTFKVNDDTISIELETTIRESDFDAIDIRITETGN